MKAFSYKRLLDISNSVPPYRGFANRFPIGSRKHNNKYFLKREEDGQIVFDIVYGESWKYDEISKEEYVRGLLENRQIYGRGRKQRNLRKIYYKYRAWDHKTGQHSKEFTYTRRTRNHNIHGVVRPDNTFEFTKKHYWQGDRCFLSQHSAGDFVTDSRRGGLIFRTHNLQMVLPIWTGMRVDCDSMMPTTPFKVVISHVNRKSSKELISRYETMFKVSEAMLKSMNLATLWDTGKELLDALSEGFSVPRQAEPSDVEKAESLVNEAPLDAFLTYALAFNTRHFAYKVRSEHSRSYETDEYCANLFMPTKRVITDHIYKKHPEILKPIEYEGGKNFPACKWGVKVIVDGKEVSQVC